MQIINRLQKLNGSKSEGFMLASGQCPTFMHLARDKLETGITDLITPDGAEGDTGAGLHRRIGIIDSGKIVGGFAMVQKLDIGADQCIMRRPFMFSLDCN